MESKNGNFTNYTQNHALNIRALKYFKIFKKNDKIFKIFTKMIKYFFISKIIKKYNIFQSNY